MQSNTQSERIYMPTFTGSSTPSSISLYDADGIRETKAATVFWDYGYLPDGTLIEESNTIGQLTNYIYLDGQPIALYGLVTTARRHRRDHLLRACRSPR